MEFTNMKKIGILGAGIMGPGIAEVLAIFGSDYDFQIYIYDISEQALQAADFRMDNDFQKVESVGLFSSEDLYKARERIFLGTDFDLISDSQLIIEAVPEKIELKKEIFKKLDQYTSSSTILATNSSGLSITEIASATDRPELCIGTHFMNPPLLMPLVEVVKGEKTSEAVVQTMIEFLSSINKRPVLVKKDLPGYVHNRLQAAIFREIMYLVNEDVMNVDDLETTVRYGLGLRLPVMKVFEMVDLMGLDTIQNVLSYLYPSLASSKKPPEFLSRMIEEGRLGVKSGKGFHDYSQANMQESMRQKESATFQLLMMMQQYD